jgi:hypothetical protein
MNFDNTQGLEVLVVPVIFDADISVDGDRIF